MPLPTFDDWVTYCFTRGQREFSGELPRSDEFDLPASILAEYMIRLFESPAFLADRFTAPEIAAGVWFLFGVGSGYVRTVTSPAIPKDVQSRFLRSIAVMYTDFFDHVCGERGEAPDDQRTDEPVDGAVYMIWDMDQLGHFLPDRPDLQACAEDVLTRVLARCLTSACLQSALHGIGHMIEWAKMDGDTETQRRLERIIDRCTSSRRLPDWLAAYAADARSGIIQ